MGESTGLCGVVWVGSGGGAWWGLQGPQAARLPQLGPRSPGDREGCAGIWSPPSESAARNALSAAARGWEQWVPGASTCARTGRGCRGMQADGLCCLPRPCGLSVANSHLESMSFPNEAPECCLLNKLCLSIRAFMQGAGSPGHSRQKPPRHGAAAGGAASFPPGPSPEAPGEWPPAAGSVCALYRFSFPSGASATLQLGAIQGAGKVGGTQSRLLDSRETCVWARPPHKLSPVHHLAPGRGRAQGASLSERKLLLRPARLRQATL